MEDVLDDELTMPPAQATRTVVTLSDARTALGATGFAGTGQPWFRGHAKHAWRLEPVIEREGLQAFEREMLNAFEVEATRFVGRPLSSTWEVMTLAQHHRLPTRFLDWTSSLYVALHFACNGHETFDGALYVMDPRSFNNETKHARAEVFMFGRTATLADATLQAHLGSRRGASPNDPFAVISPYAFDRIGNQEGSFVVCPPNGPRLETFLREGSFERWRVPADAKGEILTEIEAAGYTDYRLFPTLDTAAEHIRRAFDPERK